MQNRFICRSQRIPPQRLRLLRTPRPSRPPLPLRSLGFLYFLTSQNSLQAVWIGESGLWRLKAAWRNGRFRSETLGIYSHRLLWGKRSLFFNTVIACVWGGNPFVESRLLGYLSGLNFIILSKLKLPHKIEQNMSK